MNASAFAVRVRASARASTHASNPTLIKRKSETLKKEPEGKSRVERDREARRAKSDGKPRKSAKMKQETIKGEDEQRDREIPKMTDRIAES